MADLLKFKGKQIGAGELNETHLSPTTAIPESNLALDVATQDLSDGLDDLANKIFIGHNLISNIASDAVPADITTAVNAAALTDTPTGSAVATGVIVTAPNNKCQVRDHNTGQVIEYQPGGPDVYARLTHNGTDYVLSFFYELAGVETAYTFGASTAIDVMFPEAYFFTQLPATALVNGAAFTDSLPASHQHPLTDIQGVTESTTALDDLVLKADLASTTSGSAGASTVGVDNTTFTNLTSTTVQAALAELDGLVGSGVATRVVGEKLHAQVGDATPAVFTVSIGRYKPGTLAVYVNSGRQDKTTSTTDSGIYDDPVNGGQVVETSPATGEFTFVPNAIPTAGEKVTVDYDYE